jgi:hypothetical protein
MSKGFMAAAILAALLGAGVEARERDGREIAVTVSVFNDAGIPPEVLRAAGIRARLVLENAGMALTWIDCGSPGRWRSQAGCAAISFPSHLSLRLVKRAASASEDTFGQSFLDSRGQGSYASIYTEAIRGSRLLGTVSEGNMLGYVAAHEIGHLLLGRDSHSSSGLMSPVWRAGEVSRAAKGNLFFTTQEREKIHARLLLVVSSPQGAPAGRQLETEGGT